eukprot:scaffold2542_cov325-Prasinococcus_capsulatus_cf.AAC.4
MRRRGGSSGGPPVRLPASPCCCWSCCCCCCCRAPPHPWTQPHQDLALAGAGGDFVPAPVRCGLGVSQSRLRHGRPGGKERASGRSVGVRASPWRYKSERLGSNCLIAISELNRVSFGPPPKRGSSTRTPNRAKWQIQTRPPRRSKTSNFWRMTTSLRSSKMRVCPFDLASLEKGSDAPASQRLVRRWTSIRSRLPVLIVSIGPWLQSGAKRRKTRETCSSGR